MTEQWAIVAVLIGIVTWIISLVVAYSRGSADEAIKYAADRDEWKRQRADLYKQLFDLSHKREPKNDDNWKANAKEQVEALKTANRIIRGGRKARKENPLTDASVRAVARLEKRAVNKINRIAKGGV